MEQETFLNKYGVKRQGTASFKWDYLKETFGESDLLPLWVADMEFKCPQTVSAALMERVEHGAFGYSKIPNSYYQAYCQWQQKRHQIEVQPDWLRFGVGVVSSLSQLINLFTEKQEAVLIMQPVYYPFMDLVEQNDRQLVVSDLINTSAGYQMDLADIAAKIDANKVKLLILCSPHNPIGRVWSEAELNDLLALCREKQVIVISDEIHHDLIMPGQHFTSVLSVNEGIYRDNVVVLDSPSKTFNLAALKHSHLIMPNPQMRARYDKQATKFRLPAGSLLGAVAGEVAYQTGETWLDALINVIESNYRYVKSTLAPAVPGLKISPLQGSYLVWIDLNEVIPADELAQFMTQQAKLAVDFGNWFGESGRGFIRINLATQPENVQLAVERLLMALGKEK